MLSVIGYLLSGIALTHVHAASEFDVGLESSESADVTFDVRRSTLDLRRSTLDLRRSTLDLRRSTLDVCYADPPEYYAINLVSTKRLPGTRMASGKADVTFAPSPYGIHISPNGTYVYDVSIKIDQLRRPEDGLYVAWLTTPDLKEIIRLGPLDESGSIEGRVDWNKFLVVVTLEEADNPDQKRWAGPIALRGLSRSGFMHTMAGHGPFDQEPCAFYGYE